MPYTKKQQHYINVFMQQVEVVITLLNTPQPTSLETALTKANELINAANTALDTTTTILSVAGIAAAVPTAGMSLAAAGAAITAVQVASSGYKLVKRTVKGEESNPLSSDYSDKEDKELSLKVLCREVATIIAATRYRYMIEEIVTDKGAAEFARYGAYRVLKKIYNDNPSLDNLPTADIILDYLTESTDLSKTKRNPTVTVKKEYRSKGLLLDLDHYAKWAYSRSLVVSTDVTAGKLDYVFYASDEGWGKGVNTTQVKYGFLFLPNEKQLVYSRLRNAKPIPRPGYFTDLEPLLCASYIVSREEVQAYLDEVNQSTNTNISTRLSFNDYLKRELGITVIAEYDGKKTILQGLPLHGGNFSGVNFCHANLSECALHDTCWTDAHLDGAILGGVPISLENAIFTNITAEQSHWDQVDFSGSDFTYARMNGARLNACLLQNLNDKNSIWELATFTNMVKPEKSFIDRLNAEEQARVQLELRVLGLERRMEEIDYRQNIHEQKFEQVDIHLRTLLPKWPQTTYSVPAHIPEQLHAIYGAWKIAFENSLLQQTLHYYIELDALPYRNAPDTQRVKLLEGIESFYTNQSSLLLLHGDVGSGKSSAARLCQQRLWECWHNEKDWVPLVIELKQVPSKVKNFLKERLHAPPYGFNDEQIDYLQKHYKFFIILDGLDECPEASLRKIKEDCELDKWCAKVLLTARTEWLQVQPDYRRTLLHDNASEIFIRFLTEVQINEYLQRRFADTDILWCDYQHLWKQETELHELAKSPVLLHIIYEVLPQVMAQLTDGKKHNRAWLYNIFLKAWFQREINKPHPLDTVRKDNEILMQCFFDYMRNLAFRMFCEKTLMIERIYRPNRISYFRDTSVSDPWAEFFDSDNEVKQQAQRSCPLSLERFELEGKKYHRYQFIHKSLMEYATASFLWQALQDPEDNLGDSLPLWNQRFITEERSVLGLLTNFLVESKTKERDEERLLDMLHKTLGKPENAKAASTVITLLNSTKFNFSNHERTKNLLGLYIQHADLTEAMLGFVNWSGDFSNVCFINATLVGALFNNSKFVSSKFSTVISIISARDKVSTITAHKDYPDLIAYADGLDIIIAISSSGSIFRSYSGHTEKICALTWSKNGKMLASGGLDGKLFLWNLASENKSSIEIYHQCRDPIFTIVFNPNATKIAFAGYGGNIYIFDINDKSITVLQFNTESTYFLAWSFDSLYFLSCGTSCTIYLCHENEKRCVQQLNGTKKYKDIKWISSQDFISLNIDGEINLWSIRSFNELQSQYQLVVQIPTATCLAYCLESGLIAVGDKSGKITLVDINFPSEKACIARLESNSSYIQDIIWIEKFKVAYFNADSGIFVSDISVYMDKKIKIYNGNDFNIVNVACSPSGEKIAIAFQDFSIRIENIHDFNNFHLLKEHLGEILVMSWSSDGNKLASGSRDCYILVWNLSEFSPEPLYRLKHPHWVTSISWSPCMRFLTSGSQNGQVYIRDGDQESIPIVESFSHFSIIVCVIWSPNAKYLAIADRDKIVVFDALKKFSLVFSGKGHSDLIANIAWSPDSLKLASSSYGNSIRIWDVLGKKCIKTIGGQSGNKILIWNGEWLISISGQETYFLDTIHGFSLKKFKIGSISVSAYKDYIAFVNKSAVYIMNCANLPEKNSLTQISIIGKRSLWAQGCNFNESEGMSLNSCRLLENEHAFLKYTVPQIKIMTPSQIMLISNRLKYGIDNSHQDILESLVRVGDEFYSLGDLEEAKFYYLKARNKYSEKYLRNCNFELLQETELAQEDSSNIRLNEGHPGFYNRLLKKIEDVDRICTSRFINESTTQTYTNFYTRTFANYSSFKNYLSKK